MIGGHGSIEATSLEDQDENRSYWKWKADRKQEGDVLQVLWKQWKLPFNR